MSSTNDPHLIKTPVETTESTMNTNESNKYSEVNQQQSQEKQGSTAHTQTNLKGAETVKQEVLDSEHVNEGDNPARQPDRRDQQGNAFDGGINAETLERQDSDAHSGKHEPQSDEITDLNRYATVDNAQTRALNNSEQGE